METTNKSEESSLFLSIYPKGYEPYQFNWYDILIAVIVFILMSIAYIKTLTPSVCAGDSGELTTAVYNMGACHPPGYPLYGIIGKLFTYIPVGDIGYRVNLFSAISAAGAVLFIFLILLKLLGLNRDTGKIDVKIHVPAIAGSILFAFSFTQWSQAVIGEVYALNAVLSAGMLYLMVLWYEEMIYYRNEGKLHFAERLTLLLAFIMGLSITNHQLPIWYIVSYAIVLLPMTIMVVISDRSEKFFKQFQSRIVPFTIFIVLIGISLLLFMKNAYNNRLIFPNHVPAILFAIFLVPGFLTLYSFYVKILKLEENWVDDFFRIFTIGIWLFIFAVTIYLYLLIRARAVAPLPEPKPLSWGDTQTLDILFNHMLRKQYGAGGGNNLNNFTGQLKAVFEFNVRNFNIVNIVIAFIGIIVMFLKDKVMAMFTLFSMLFFDIALVKFINFEIDPRTLSFQEVFFIQAFMIVAIYAAFGYQLFLDVAQKGLKALPGYDYIKDKMESTKKEA